ncbi:hypothetical protein T05_317 [Trichinella murrelli]|uniref:Uncharacterized protein n=1 Tax=Trichinella murrelli TaxID=144512 RepID=A0A0V0UDW3_9BILA|nr:hypothetical protein T05_317 [Trichinella murrelli]
MLALVLLCCPDRAMLHLGVVTNLLLIHPSFPTAAAILQLYYCFSCNERERVREFKNCLADNKRNVYMMLWNNEC